MEWKVVALLSLAVMTLVLLNAAWHTRKIMRVQYRRAYRNGLIAGYAKCEAKWRHRKAVELHNAGRRAAVREDAGPPAHVSKVRFQSGP